MTALNKYDRLEATGLWRATANVQRREVIVSLGKATLVITDLQGQALTHWSLAALERLNPKERTAIYHPEGDPGETLELTEKDAEMIEAIETLRKTVVRRRPRPGRLRWLGSILFLALMAALAVFWLPGAMQDNTLRVVPQVKRAAIGDALLSRMQRVTGPACRGSTGVQSLNRLSARLNVSNITILPDMTQPSLHLPGGRILLARKVIEDFEEPDVAAGFILEQVALRSETDPLRALLRRAGAWENIRLLTTGDISETALDLYAQELLTPAKTAPQTSELLDLFRTAKLRSTPYARARDITGETVLDLIEGDPMQNQETQMLLSDADWLRLQSICGG